MFRYVSLFSGIGGFEQALNSLGGECVFSSEINKQANKSYKALYGHETYGDVTKIQAKDVPDHDLLVGGFPCQTFSVAGNQRGFDDARGTLFFEIARIAKEKKPKALLLENVKGLLGHEKGVTIHVLLNTLSEIGYRFDIGLVNSSEFGLPQNRERIFFVCIREDLVKDIPDREAPMINRPTMKRVFKFLKEKDIHLLNLDWPESKEPVGLSTFLDVLTDSSYYLDEEHVDNILTHLKERDIIEGLHAGPLSEIDYKLTHEKYEVRALITPKKVTVRHNGRRFKMHDEPSHTLTCLDKHGVLFIFGNQAYARLFTIEEMFRLQGFPDNVIHTLKAAGITAPQLQKQIGNAVSVPVVREVAKLLLPYITSDEKLGDS